MAKKVNTKGTKILSKKETREIFENNKITFPGDNVKKKTANEIIEEYWLCQKKLDQLCVEHNILEPR